MAELIHRDEGRHSAGPHPAVAVRNSLLVADVTITTHDSWDEVNLSCTYRLPQAPPGNYTALAADATGRKQEVGSWPVIPGQTAILHTPTTFHSGKITSVSILNAAGSTVAQLDI